MSEPRRYEGNGVTCADALESMAHGCDLPPMALWWWGCALKYLWRWPWKNGVEDLGKARDCISRLERELADACDDSTCGTCGSFRPCCECGSGWCMELLRPVREDEAACEEHDPDAGGRSRG